MRRRRISSVLSFLVVGAALLAATLVLPTAQTRSTIPITSENPLLERPRDISDAGSNISLELEKIPTARDPWSVLNQTPGVQVDRLGLPGPNHPVFDPEMPTFVPETNLDLAAPKIGDLLFDPPASPGAGGAGSPNPADIQALDDPAGKIDAQSSPESFVEQNEPWVGVDATPGMLGYGPADTRPTFGPIQGGATFDPQPGGGYPVNLFNPDDVPAVPDRNSNWSGPDWRNPFDTELGPSDPPFRADFIRPPTSPTPPYWSPFRNEMRGSDPAESTGSWNMDPVTPRPNPYDLRGPSVRGGDGLPSDGFQVWPDQPNPATDPPDTDLDLDGTLNIPLNNPLNNPWQLDDRWSLSPGIRFTDDDSEPPADPADLDDVPAHLAFNLNLYPINPFSGSYVSPDSETPETTTVGGAGTNPGPDATPTPEPEPAPSAGGADPADAPADSPNAPDAPAVNAGTPAAADASDTVAAGGGAPATVGGAPTDTPAASDAAPPAVADPACDLCDPIAQKLRDALQRQQDLQAESDKVDQRLGEIPGELNEAQQTQQDLQDEYDRRLAETRVRSGDLEAGYYEVGGSVYIGLGTTQGGAFVPDVVPDPNTPQNLGDASGPRRSPYMTRLKERIDAAEADVENLEAEQDQLNDQRTQLDADLVAAQAAVDQLRQELEDCLKRCGEPGSINIQLTLNSPGTTPVSGAGPAGGPSVSIFVGNPTDLLDDLNIYALQTPDGVPYALARPDLPVDDRYQLFITLFIRGGRSPGPLPETDLRPGDALNQPRWSPWDRVSHTARRWLSGAFSLLAPPVYAGVPAATLAPGTLVRLGAAGQAGAPPALSLVATGASSGEALTLEMADAGGTPVQVVAPDGLVLQAVRQGAGRRVSQSGGPVTTSSITGFCLEYQKPPPPADTLYQVAPESVQERFQPMRSILEAGRSLAEGGLLNPDSDPLSYATFIQQWALWTELEDWDAGGFTRAFIDRTRQNVENSGQQFTNQMRDALEEAAPNRFNDILTVLVEAEGLTGRLPFSLAQ